MVNVKGVCLQGLEGRVGAGLNFFDICLGGIENKFW